ncbi:MAG TPA: thioredoxin domain-containing protein [Rhizomicrobium sp.]|jgi:protein-disulfide isomerase|nr:thioredoxin domain-containing protein [Rhizomicrobium sp.]
MSRKYLLVGLVVVALGVLGVAAWYVFVGASSESAIPNATQTQAVTVTASDHTMGSPKAPIQIVEYAAPQCPHCAHFDMTAFPLLKQNFIDPGKVYYILRIYPLGPADVAVGAMANCLPRSQFFEFLDLMWRNQSKWDPEFRVPDVHTGLVDMGRIAGMSADKVDSCIANQAVSQQITQIGQDAVQKYGISSVPTFIVNGQVRQFTGSWDEMQTYLNGLLKKQ